MNVQTRIDAKSYFEVGVLHVGEAFAKSDIIRYAAED